MNEPHFLAKACEETGLLTFEMNRAGFELLDKVLSRAHPSRQDSQRGFKAAKDRVSGGLMAAAAVMGWVKK